MSLTRRIATAGAIAAAAVAALPSAASAGIWTPVASGTGDEISAIDYRSPAQVVFTTTTGKIFGGGLGSTVQQASFPGRQFFDVAMRPSGDVGLATADSGKLFRFAAGAWTPVDLKNSSFDQDNPCASTPSGTPAGKSTPTANLLAVAWGSDNVAWVVSADRGQVLKSTDGGATFSDVSRQADGTCKIGGDVTDVATVPGSDQDVYFVDDDFASLYRTADGLTSSAQERIELVNCFSVRMKLAIDPTAPNRVSAVGACPGTLQQGFSADSGTTKNYTDSDGGPLRDIAGQAGLFLAVGDAGLIEQTFDGKAVFKQPADADLSTKDWRATDFADASHAVVAGVGGALVATDRANTPPDLLAPTVNITGPDTVTVGTPVAYTANAQDNAGGSGVNPAGFQWTGTGLQPTSAGTANYTFPSTGTFAVSVKVTDFAGNVSETATKSVTVVQPVPTLPAGTPISGKGGKKKKKFIVFQVFGRLLPPTGVAKSAACVGKMSLKFSKGKKKLVTKKAKLSSKTCRYKKTVKIPRKKVGKARKLKLTVSFPGNAAMGPVKNTYKVKVLK